MSGVEGVRAGGGGTGLQLGPSCHTHTHTHTPPDRKRYTELNKILASLVIPDTTETQGAINNKTRINNNTHSGNYTSNSEQTKKNTAGTTKSHDKKRQQTL